MTEELYPRFTFHFLGFVRVPDDKVPSQSSCGPCERHLDRNSVETWQATASNSVARCSVCLEFRGPIQGNSPSRRHSLKQPRTRNEKHHAIAVITALARGPMEKASCSTGVARQSHCTCAADAHRRAGWSPVVVLAVLPYVHPGPGALVTATGAPRIPPHIGRAVWFGFGRGAISRNTPRRYVRTDRQPNWYALAFSCVQ